MCRLRSVFGEPRSLVVGSNLEAEQADANGYLVRIDMYSSTPTPPWVVESKHSPVV